MTKTDILKIFERYENIYGDGLQKRRWDEVADEILAKIFLQPDVSPNEGNQISSDKKDGEVALPLSFVNWYSGMKTETILKAYERWKIESGNDR